MQWPLSIGLGEPNGAMSFLSAVVTISATVLWSASRWCCSRRITIRRLRTMTATKLSRPFRERNALEHRDRDLTKDLAQEIEICTGDRAKRLPRCTASLPSRATENFCRPQKARVKNRRRRAELGRSRDTLLRAREAGSIPRAFPDRGRLFRVARRS